MVTNSRNWAGYITAAEAICNQVITSQDFSTGPILSIITEVVSIAVIDYKLVVSTNAATWAKIKVARSTNYYWINYSRTTQSNL